MGKTRVPKADDRAGMSTDEDSGDDVPAENTTGPGSNRGYFGKITKREKKTNKRKVMLVSSRGITHRLRHLMADLLKLLPHSKKDAKFDMKDGLRALNEVAYMKSCDCTMML